MRSTMIEHPLRTYRKSMGLTQGELAGVLGVSDATITHIENFRRKITPVNAREWERRIPLSKEVLCPDVFGPSLDQVAA